MLFFALLVEYYLLAIIYVFTINGYLFSNNFARSKHSFIHYEFVNCVPIGETMQQLKTECTFIANLYIYGSYCTHCNYVFIIYARLQESARRNINFTNRRIVTRYGQLNIGLNE